MHGRESMATTSEGAAKVPLTRRRLLTGAAVAALVVAAGGGAGYYYFSGQAPMATTPAHAEPSPADVAQPGPLGDEVMGAADAPVTIVEYASMTCPHCAHFHEAIFPELKKKYIDTGKVRFIFREFPLDALAAGASALARCAGKDKYFPLVETLFAQQREWVVQKPLQPLLAIARQAGFTEQSFNQCLENQQVIQGIEQTRERAAKQLNVRSTPTFFINGKLFQFQAMTFEEIDKKIASYLTG
jgi:protein-disulfide isomerase